MKKLLQKHSAAPRITHVISTPDSIGGAERVVQALVHGGSERGWEQQVLNPFVRDPGSAALREIVPQDTYRGARCQQWQELPTLYRWLVRELRAFAPDVIHTHLFHAAVAVSLVPRRHGEVRIHSQHHGDQFTIRRERHRELLDRLVGHRHDRVICVSRATREFLVARYGYPPQRLELILNGWAGRPLPSVATTTSPTIICVASLSPQKGHDVLIAAFAQVCARLSTARLLLVGQGELDDAIRADIVARGLGDRVQMCGAVDDVWPLLAQAHVFALASHYEPLGIAILEAMAAGLPVVATAVGGIPELVRPGVTGELVPGGDVDALADRLVELLEASTRREALGRAAAVHASHFTSEKMVEDHFLLYERLRMPV